MEWKSIIILALALSIQGKKISVVSNTKPNGVENKFDISRSLVVMNTEKDILSSRSQGSCAIDCRKTAGCSGFTYDKTNNVCTLGGVEGQEFRDCYGTLDFSDKKECGEWKRVRHVPQGNTWYRYSDTDDLKGTETYGDPGDDSQPWSVAWITEDYQEFLFTSVDLEYWMIVSKEELIGNDGDKSYWNEPVLITASSESDTSYKAKMSRSSWTDPQLSLRFVVLKDSINSLCNPAGPAVVTRDYDDTELVIYKEGGVSGDKTSILEAHGGIDVYIRKTSSWFVSNK